MNTKLHLFRLLLVCVLSLLFTFNLFSQIQNSYVGINPENIDMSVDPNVNFYDYSNGNWLRNNPVPPEYSRWSTWNVLINKNQDVLRKILEDASNNPASPKGSTLQKLGDLYFLAMDTVAIENTGLNPLKEYLAQIDGISSKEDFQRVFSNLKSFRTGGLFNFFANQDDRNSQNVILQLFQSGLGLPDRDYYLKDDERSKKLRSQYGEFAVKLFELMGDDNSAAIKNARRIMDIEMRLAKASMSRVDMREAEATYHLMTLNELQSLTPDFSWDIFFNEIGLSDKSKFDNGINVGQPEFFKEVNRMLTDVSIEDWKTYLKWNLLRSAADKLSSDFSNASFDFYSKTLRGTLQQQPRWKESLQFVEGAMGEPLGELFAAQRFTPETKAKALEMVANIKEAFRVRLLANEWMSDRTKQEALKKLATFDVKIGYTDKWKDYSKLDIDRSSLAENLIRATKYNMKLNLDKIGKPVEKSEWFMLPQTVNASYNSSKNDITFPAGIMQPPFYDPNADDAVNYGSIGSVIGHEITHGFDDQGRKYDADGNLKDWWTEDDAKNFEERADKLVAQYSSYQVADSLNVKGELTLGENIADLGGLLIAYDALQKSLEGKDRPMVGGFTPEQRFFLGFSQVWSVNARPESLRLQVNTDPHSPGKFRVIGTISNVPAFMKAFNGKEGDPMINDSQKRVVIW